MNKESHEIGDLQTHFSWRNGCLKKVWAESPLPIRVKTLEFYWHAVFAEAWNSWRRNRNYQALYDKIVNRPR